MALGPRRITMQAPKYDYFDLDTMIVVSLYLDARRQMVLFPVFFGGGQILKSEKPLEQ